MTRARGRSIRKSFGFTLVEMMFTLGLVAIVYTLVSGILVQIARYVKDGRRVARSRYELISTVEDLRYQLRSLYYPDGGPGLSGSRTQTEGWSNLRFLTTNGHTHKGVVEVGYQIQTVEPEEEEKEKTTALFYREFRFRQNEFRTMDPYQEAPWKTALSNVSGFDVQYSSGGGNWQNDWDQPESPQRVRVLLQRGGNNHDHIVFDVTPGVGAQRW